MRTLLVLSIVVLLGAPLAVAQPCCLVSDNGTGTVDLPPECFPDGYEGALQLLEGLPPGSTVEMTANLTGFSSSSVPGGSLGGTVETWTAVMELEVTGTGTLAGFQRTLSVPVTGETHAAPRTPGAPVQSFAFQVTRLQGILTGDYDFSLLWFEGGANFLLPSPGWTTLTRQGGPGADFAVESGFDYNYRIQFEGQQESLWLEGWRGITLDLEERFQVCTAAAVTGVGDAVAGPGLRVGPNPMRSRIAIDVDAGDGGGVHVAVYDARGRRVATVAENATATTFQWSGRSDAGLETPPGVYFVTVSSGAGVMSRRIVRLP